jgi:hypothetical protein
MIWVWLGALAVGLSLGLLGSGGAILTVPVLVYLVGHDEKVAIVESLAVVGIIALVSAARAAARGLLDVRNASLLALPGLPGAALGAAAARLVPGSAQLALLAVLMLTAAAMVFRPAKAPRETGPAHAGGWWLIAVQGLGLGFITGLVGVGGGFLIVPVLVLIRGLPMPTAVGTSLAIIAINCAGGLASNLAAAEPGLGPHWPTVGMFAALGITGSLAGGFLGGRIPQQTLRRVFAVFLVVMAAYVLVRQAPKVLPEYFARSAAVNNGNPSASARLSLTSEGRCLDPNVFRTRRTT